MNFVNQGCDLFSFNVDFRQIVDNKVKNYISPTLKLPFHPISYVTNSSDKKTIETAFASSWGYYESGNFS